jgi:hypothetical protein
MRLRLGHIAPAVGLLAIAIPASAHHGFAVEYDAKKCADMKGTLTSVDWENPHVHFTMDVKDADGKVSSWKIEVNSIPAMKRSAGIQRQDFLDNIGRRYPMDVCTSSGRMWKAWA